MVSNQNLYGFIQKEGGHSITPFNFFNMARKTLTVDVETWKRLNKLKYKFSCLTIDEVIDRLINLLTKFKMVSEFKEIKIRGKT